MKNSTLITVLLVAAILVSCAPIATVVPTEIIPTSTLTLTPAPTATATITPTITPEPTPMGGGELKVAFYATDPTGDYLVVGDYFSGKIYYKIRIRHMSPAEDVSWSPDGAYVLFVDPPVAARETENLKVNLLNVKTGQVILLNALPASDGVQWNRLRHIEWSPDSKYVLYNGTNLASVDGIVQNTQAGFSDWLPDSKTLVSFGREYTFDVEKKERGSLLIPGFAWKSKKSFDLYDLTQDYILLDPFDRDKVEAKDKVEAILYPKDIRDTTAWEYDALVSNKVTLITFSPEIKKPQIYRLMNITELPNHQLSISGRGVFTVGEKTYSGFTVIVNKKSLPVVVEEKDLFAFWDETPEFPVAYSPDGQLMLTVTLLRKAGSGFNNAQWTVKNTSGQEIQSNYKLPQFEGLVDVGAGVANVTASDTRSFFSAIDFYWQP